MKVGDKIVKTSEILTIEEVENRDAKTGLVTYVCKNGEIRIPEQEIGKYTKID